MTAADRLRSLPPEWARRLALSVRGRRSFLAYHRLGHAALLDKAVAALRGAAGPAHESRSAGRLAALGNVLVYRFSVLGEKADLEEAIACARRGAAVADPGLFEHALCLSVLGTGLRARYLTAGDKADLDAAIDAARDAVRMDPPNPCRSEVLNILGSCLSLRFALTGDLLDIDAAVDAGRRAVAAAGGRNLDRSLHLSMLAASLRRRFYYAGDMTDLDDAVSAAQEAVTAAPAGTPNRAAYLSALSDTLSARFARTGNGADLDAAVAAAQQSLDAVLAGTPNRALLFYRLSDALFYRFDRDGRDADLDAAIDAARQSVAAAAPDHTGLPGFQDGLGAQLLMRYERSSDLADLTAAVDVLRQAVAGTAPGNILRGARLANLSASLQDRYSLSGDIADLDAAVDAARAAAGAEAHAPQDRAPRLSNLGMALRARFQAAGDRADLDAAVRAGRDAVGAMVPGDPNAALYQSTLGVTLRVRYQASGDVADHRAALDAARHALAAAGPDYPARATCLIRLGICLDTQFALTADPADRDAALATWREASGVPGGNPFIRLGAAVLRGQAAAGAGQWAEAADGHAAAVDLLAVLAWHGLNRTTREEQLGRLPGLPADAAACAISAGDPRRAVELLEQSRSVIWRQALDLRGDLTRLKGVAPRLRERLNESRAILESPVPEMAPRPAAWTQDDPVTVSQTLHAAAAQLRRKAAREWDEALAQVRAEPGFEHFLGAVPYGELTSAMSASGPVIIVNGSRYGCHAVALRPGSDHPLVIDVPALSFEAAAENAGRLRQATTGDDQRDQGPLPGILEWLWDALAEPVLAALGHTSAVSGDGPWPRVWWCPTGPLTQLPLHAAGYHAPGAGTGDCVLDRVISSYATTVGMLTRPPRAPETTGALHLAVGVADHPGLPPLPAVPVEMEAIGRYFPGSGGHVQLAGARATRENVMTAIRTHSWVHLSCHAQQRQEDPDASGFALWDGPLTIADLAGQAPYPRELAFLSGCETATGNDRTLDEAIHLAGAMQFLGYQQVIATLWPVYDAPAALVARYVYESLCGDSPPDAGRAAEALHSAVRRLRRDVQGNPRIWAPYIHLGV